MPKTTMPIPMGMAKTMTPDILHVIGNIVTIAGKMDITRTNVATRIKIYVANVRSLDIS